MDRNQRSYSPKQGEVKQEWIEVDVSGQSLGRAASRIAAILRGKHKPQFAPHMDVGDYVVVLNAAEIRLTGKKKEQKFYHRHSGYPGGLRSVSYGDLLEKSPCRLFELAVKNMLPHNRLGRQQRKKLKVFSGKDHTHTAQKPRRMEIFKQKTAS